MTLLGIREWCEIPDDADALRPGVSISFVVREREDLARWFDLEKREGAPVINPLTWEKVAERAEALKLSESLTFVRNNNTAQTDEGEYLPPAYAFRLTLQAIIEGEVPDFCPEGQ